MKVYYQGWGETEIQYCSYSSYPPVGNCNSVTSPVLSYITLSVVAAARAIPSATTIMPVAELKVTLRAPFQSLCTMVG